MSDTVLEHPLVRQYLRAVDTACATLPLAQARELHEQLAAYLDDALPPSATIADVVAVLDRLGRPRSLAAEAAGPGGLPAWRKLCNRLRRVRWWTWTAIGLLVPAISTGAGFLISMNSATPLYSMGAGWLYPVDQAHAVETSADAVTQTTVPFRTGQRQGVEVLLSNPSDWTQVILGPSSNFQPFSNEPPQVIVETGPDINLIGTPLSGGSSYVSPGAIPPHTARWVRLTWTSDTCTGGSGTVGIIDSLWLEVRVGLATKTEVIPLTEAFALQEPSRGHCG